ncbi:MAG TPA: hypothetical protein VGZ04_11265 [Acidimicrobiales bacterium]|jgi:hypothetical protein|nr:hypothetical protein [Acidimicrobiales bacterium]
MKDGRRVRNASASMYADLLANALANLDGEWSAEDLLEHVLACRLEMLSSTPLPGDDAYLTLAKEIAYDRALIKLCVTQGVEARAADFAHPGEERSRLERALIDHGVNLAERARDGPL